MLRHHVDIYYRDILLPSGVINDDYSATAGGVV